MSTFRSLLTLIRTAPESRRLMLFALMGVSAVVVGFGTVTPQQAEWLIARGGYYYMLGLFALALYFGWQVAAARRAVWSHWFARPGLPAIAVLAAVALSLWSDSFRHKVLFDEYVLQGTAWHMHATKEIGTVIRAYDLFGTWLPIDTFLDKRPYFFTFLLSLVHDLTGYRIENVFVLNAALTAVFFGLTHWFGCQLTNRTGGLLAVALLATLPLVGQNATGAGMEIHNLTMLLITMCAALLYLRAPDANRLALLCLATVLLAQSRYESVIFVAPVAVIILAGWRRADAVLLPWAALLAPLLLVPYAWHNRVVSATPLLWQLQDGQTARFSTEYLPANLEGAWNFFFNVGPALANSWWLSVVGFASLVGLLILGARRLASGSRVWPRNPAIWVLATMGAGVAVNFTMLMFYYWSRLDDTIASRFALPSCLVLAFVATLMACRLEPRFPAPRAAFIGTAVFVLVSALPSMAKRLYTSQNQVMLELAWEHEIVTARNAGPVLVISNKSTIPWVLWEIPSIINGVARLRPDHIRWHLERETFREVIVAQALRPTTRDGRFGIDPEDALPERFHLETIAEKRFGGRMARLSRIVAIDPAPEPTPSAEDDVPRTLNPGGPAT